MYKICFTISIFHTSTCFEHNVLIVRRPKLYYTASGIITPIGGRPVHRLIEDLVHREFKVYTGVVHVDTVLSGRWVSTI